MSVVRFRPEAPTHAGVAQLAEQLICNQQVVGSIPITSSNANAEPTPILYGKIPERPNGSDCKSDVYDFGSSNLPLPTSKRDTQQGIPFAVEEVIEARRRSVVRASGAAK